MTTFRLLLVGFSACSCLLAQAPDSAAGNPPQATTPVAQRENRRGQNPTEPTPPNVAPPKGEAKPIPATEERSSITRHTASIGGGTMRYTATAGNYILKADDGIPKASMFFVAYTKDDVADPAGRPVAFVFNGGPGSASLFTHMGLGPQHVVLSPDGHGMPAPYRVEDNHNSFLDAADLVFIDAISTGYSRPVAGQDPKQFYGVIPDANWFSDFVYQYVTRNARWASPKFLIGESYGTTRAAEMAGVLQERHQIYLNGIVLLSSVAFSNFGADDRARFWLPTFAMSAWYHKLLAPDLQKLSITEMAARAREFAHGEYSQALEKGDALTSTERGKAVEQMARFTGLKPKFIDNCNLRVTPQRWFRELERDGRKVVGRLDARFESYEADAAGEDITFDASEISYEGAYVATFQDYVRRELRWGTDMYYTVTARVQPWDQNGGIRVAEVLRGAMTQTGVKLLVLCGYYDLATPFNGIEYTVDHMGLEPEFRKNVKFAYYESGHMVYIDSKANTELHRDVDGFIKSSYVQR